MSDVTYTINPAHSQILINKLVSNLIKLCLSKYLVNYTHVSIDYIHYVLNLIAKILLSRFTATNL